MNKGLFYDAATRRQVYLPLSSRQAAAGYRDNGLAQANGRGSASQYPGVSDAKNPGSSGAVGRVAAASACQSADATDLAVGPSNSSSAARDLRLRILRARRAIQKLGVRCEIRTQIACDNAGYGQAHRTRAADGARLDSAEAFGWSKVLARLLAQQKVHP